MTLRGALLTYEQARKDACWTVAEDALLSVAYRSCPELETEESTP